MMIKCSVLIFATCCLFVQASHWAYPTEAPNGVIVGKEDWEGKCAQGRRQSPVDLAEDASVLGEYSPLNFINYDDDIKNGKVRNSGHSIQLDIPAGQKYYMTGGGLPGQYVMDQMHFHWSSEHTINSKRYGLELHMVSHDTKYGNITEAVKHKNGVAVLGILFHVSDRPNLVLKNILDSTEAIKNDVGVATLLKSPLRPEELLPKKRNSFFRYEGSLTTPSCDEAVIWTVLDESVPFAMSQIERFKDIKDEHGLLLTHNFRQLQRLNSRPLVYVREARHSGNSVESSSNDLSLSEGTSKSLSSAFINDFDYQVSRKSGTQPPQSSAENICFLLTCIILSPEEDCDIDACLKQMKQNREMFSL